MSRFCVLLQILSVIICGHCNRNLEYVVKDCMKQCDTALDTLDERGILFCDKECRQHECQTGCGYYQDGLTSSCKSVCDKDKKPQSVQEITSQTKVQNCVRGCNIALGLYEWAIEREMGMLPEPELIRNSIKSTFVELTWSGKILPNVTYLVHRKIIENETQGVWQLHSDAELHNDVGLDVTFYITNLHPYVTYKFMIIAVVSKFHVLESLESIPITTKQQGVPESSPIITGISALSSTVIALSWRQPSFTNGPLIGYRISLNPQDHVILKEINKEVPGNATSWTFGHLQSSQLYIVTISAWNREGEGPTSQGSATTLNPGNLTVNETPYLILGADNKVYKQNLIDIFSLPDKVHQTQSRDIIITGKTTLFEAEGEIKGIGIHIKRQQIFISDSTGKVHLVPLGTDQSQAKSDLYPSLLKPTTISIDWLNDRAFIISRNRIYSCPLYKENDACVIVIDNLQTTASDVKVDPLNGYMYYCDDRGIFRVDLADVGKHGPLHQTQMVANSHISSFALDFYTMQLYYPDTTNNTMMATFFDGNEITNIRSNSLYANFSNMKSITTYRSLFYWTTGASVLSEEYDQDYHTYRQNNLLFFDKHYSGLNIYHPTVQPVPVPYTSPNNIQALFNSHSVQISWQPPQVLEYQGRGAWNKWKYEVEIQYYKNDSKKSVISRRVSGLTLIVDRLPPDRQYSVKIRGTSVKGDGPWSEFFVGRTLKYEPIPVKIYLAAQGQILEHDLNKYKLQTIRSTYSKATDLAWYGDHVMWTNSDGKLLMYNRKTKQQSINKHARVASCLTFDWLGKKIFWSEPDKRVSVAKIMLYEPGGWVDGVIRRSDMNGIVSDSIYQTAARDMTIDSVTGRIYWATINTIESTYLNGEDHAQIFTIPFFSGKHVISLTLNFNLQKILWYVKSYESQDLYMADLIGLNGVNSDISSTTVKKFGDFHSISRTSGLQYYSYHLFWLDQSDSLVVGDHEGNYSSVIFPEKHNMYITAFAVNHPSLQQYPEGLDSETTVVIPDPMAASDISVVGHWSNFNLTWRSCTEVNHGEVYYKVYMQIRHYANHVVTRDTSYTVEGISPYTQMTVTIQPYTYWGYADSTTVPIKSPMSVPESPLTPRVYVTQHKNASTAKQSLAADFRWSTPGVINGILQHHYVYHWEKDQIEATVVRLPGTTRHFILTPLKPNNTYFFKVEACTAVGCGPTSLVVSALTDSVNPVPKLLIATKSAVRISEMDEHLNSTVMLPSVSPSAMAFLAQDERTFWVERTNALFVSKESNQIPLMQLNSTVKDMSMDWISRTLYVVEEGKDGRNKIMGYHVDQKKYKLVIDRNTTIGSVLSDPYTSSLFWTEIDEDGRGHLFQSHLNGSNVVALLGSAPISTRKRRSCTCENDINVSPLISMDYTEKGDTEIVIVDMTRKAILAIDIQGCFCREIYKVSATENHGLPPDLIAIDHMRVYWYNSDEGKLYSIYKDSGTGYIELDMPDINDMVAYGAHLQPLPDSVCLDPGAYNGSVEGIRITNSSITLKLEEVKRPEACQGISLPIDKFTIYYRKDVKNSHIDCSSQPDTCLSVESYRKEVIIDDLDVYTDYVFQVAVSNYYTEYLAEALGILVKYSTLHGAPSEARNISALPVSFRELKVKWLPPLKINGPPEGITYVVSWSTVTENGVRLQGRTESSVVRKSRRSGLLETYIKGLKANQSYDLKVLSYEYEGKLFSESQVITVKTCQNPGDIVFDEAFTDAIHILWTSPSDDCVNRHIFKYDKVTPHGPEEMQKSKLYPTDNNTQYSLMVQHLDPNTKYIFKVKVSYKNSPFRVVDWPNDDRFTFKTLTDIPAEPLPPLINQLKAGAHDVEWETPKDHGALIESYLLEFSEAEIGDWEMVYNGSDLRWHMDYKIFSPGVQYIFRVAAKNYNGWGPSSSNSSVFTAPPMAESRLDDHITISIGVSVAVILIAGIIVVTLVICLVIRKRQIVKSKARQFVNIRGPDTELAILRELPHTAVQHSNTLYAFSIVPTDDDIAALPYFRRDQLVLTRFLGSGAFGEVFEGVAKNIVDVTGETRVAVKTLRKSASDQEKDEFLKEALLMSNFKHDHILGLLGVCLDNDPQFIIMELMEGGDLLSYLRCCRATISSPPRLFLSDLIHVCVNVADGCEYLEGMHFVHRDLAARNCLVSSKNPSDMVVKIGDFGLARDIYKNDYYRKEGEGLLPVRWMSPESLVDGVFTTPSDIWAFGVLMWEVITLGQQPYPARTNVEVLHFVRSGGNLDKPDKCSEEIYSLMEKCWSFNPHERPSFSIISQKLREIQHKCSNMSSEDILQSSPHTADAGIEGTTRQVEGANMLDKKFIPSEHSLSTLTGGGSVRLTPTSKRRRLRNLLGGAEQTHEKTIDLATNARIKRTVSYDATQPNGHISYSQISQIPPTLSQIDHMGYLNPRIKTTAQYLHLINQAPEIEEFRLDAQQTLKTVRPEIHSPNIHAYYPEIQRSNPPPYSVVRNSSNGNPRSPRPSVSSEESPYFHTNINSASDCCLTNHQDSDLYLVPVVNEQVSHSPRLCAECHNNSFSNDQTGPLYSRIQERSRNQSNNNSDKAFNHSNSYKDNSTPCPDYINYHGGRKSAQVFPEPGTSLAGFEISQASLV